MFLKTVPPVVAVHSEWRTGKSFSLPLCFNDSASDTDFASSSGTPIPHKVQMIIDSLRSTQSSDMSDELPDDGRHVGRKVKPRHTEAIARSRQTTGSDTSGGSDSDDSVDRGIEEAIQEYLKEKVDHKRKGEPAISPVQPPKVQRREPVVLDPPKQLTHSNSNKVLTASNHVQRGSKCVQPLMALKKKKKPSKENPFRKTEKVLPVKAPSPGPRKSSSSCSPFADRTPPPLRIKEEEDSLDSSSDDGIEEAIQRFQQEQKEHHKDNRSWYPKDLADSSDDGIEEAIRHYQQEKKKKKGKLHSKVSPLADSQHSKLPAPSIDCASIRLTKKQNKTTITQGVSESEALCTSPKPLDVSQSLNISPPYLKPSCDALCSVRVEEPGTEQQIHSTLTVNTTAELMCAEAILDISKTVMPASFVSDLTLGKSSASEALPFVHPELPTQQEEKSNESSVDSEDGIEQEIRKFLELKAKMHEQLATGDAITACPGGPAVTKVPQKKKPEEDQSKALRLSLTRKRKCKEESDGSAKREPADNIFKEETQPKLKTQSESGPVLAANRCNPIMTKHSKPKQSCSLHRILEGTVGTKGPSRGATSPSNNQRQLMQRNYSSDKSSSLDSDEDLDAAIKDLLKTKKKVKKKVRDMKLKARKGLKPTQQLPLPPDALKRDSNMEQKNLLTAKPMKSHSLKSSKELTNLTTHQKGVKLKGMKMQPSSKKPKVSTQSTGADQGKGMESKTADSPQRSLVPGDEDSSSVDSDDSIEQEIRRFLAEKAKVSTAPGAVVKKEATGVQEAGIRERAIKEEEVEKDVLAGTTCVPNSADPQKAPMDTDLKDTDPGAASGSCCIVAEDRMDDQSTRTLEEPLVLAKSCVSERDSFGMSKEEAQCQAQHQNLFLMKPENCSMTKVKESDFTDLPSSLQNRSRIPLREVISAVCPSPPPDVKPPLAPTSTTPTAPVALASNRTASFYTHSWVKREEPHISPANSHPHPPVQPTIQPLTPHTPHNPSHLSCTPLPPALSQPRVGASIVRLRRDQAIAIALSAAKPLPLQLRNRQEEKERERTRDGVQVMEGKEQMCVDETDVESGEERRVEQQRTDKRQQRPSHMSLSTCIDPGEMLSPYIALDTEQRARKFKHMQQVNRKVKSVKRRLQLVVS